MRRQLMNPYLPCCEYVPDAEPRLFHDRLYIFGTHDAFGGTGFCVLDYVCYSAPLKNLSDWTYHGVVYRKEQDPCFHQGLAMFAPDVVQGADGRFYLYYTLSFTGRLSVAVAEKPEGPYAYLDQVRYPDGTPLGAREGDIMVYDPGLLRDEDGSVHLYLGVSPARGILDALRGNGRRMEGAYHMGLEADMRTVAEEPMLIFPGYEAARGLDFAEHAFFEAASIRKVEGQYCFIYSSIAGHELCYAMGPSPRGPFTYGGTLVSIGDVGLGGRTEKDAVNYYGNTHGSVVELNGQWYVFYHRHTNGNQFSRQGCAEALKRRPDGGFCQAELTSGGLGGILPGRGVWPAGMACNLNSAQGAFRYLPRIERDPLHPYITQDEPDNEVCSAQYIANLREGSFAGFKYFALSRPAEIIVTARAREGAEFAIHTDRDSAPVATLRFAPSSTWTTARCRLPALGEKTALYFVAHPVETADLFSFELRPEE